MTDPPRTPVSAPDHEGGAVAAGLGYGALAYGSWGFIAVYFKAVAAASPVEVLCHRVIWSVVFLAVLIQLRGRWGEVRDVLRGGGVWASLSVSTVLIAVNWLVFVYAVVADRLMEASLGYFISPLVSIVLGMAVLGERLRIGQWSAVSLAAIGVGLYTRLVGSLPWISLVLACSFGLYGLVRKRSPVGPVIGLTLETLLLAPLGVGYLLIAGLARADSVVFLDRTEGSAGLDLLLIAAGPITTLPLLWFTAAARRLRLSTVGFMQYSTPTIQFLLAAIVFREPFGMSKAIAFAIIWAGVVVYIIDSVTHTLRKGETPPVMPPE